MQLIFADIATDIKCNFNLQNKRQHLHRKEEYSRGTGNLIIGAQVEENPENNSENQMRLRFS